MRQIILLLLAIGSTCLLYGQKVTFGPVPNWVTLIPIEADTSSKEGLSRLLQDIQLHAEKEEGFVRIVFKINDLNALEALTAFSIDFDPAVYSIVFHQATAHRKNTKIDLLTEAHTDITKTQKFVAGQSYTEEAAFVLHFADLKVGDLVEVLYTIKGRQADMKGAFVCLERIQMHHYIFKRRLRIVFNENRKLLYTASDGIKPPKEASLGAGCIEQLSVFIKHYSQAALPPKETIAHVFKEFELLFMPKDIVSGDFYWFHRTEASAILAVMDCTGHGVPGAFMSLLGNDALTQAVVAERIMQPSKILYSVDQMLKRTLRQEATENRDSIDLSVCRFDFERRQLTYAGAKGLGLFVPASGEPVLLKGNKCSVGGHLPKDFDDIDIDWQEGDRLFLYSDGFQDQMGGEQGRKIMAKRLRSLLIESKGSVPETIAEAQAFLHEWMQEGRHTQIDDILLLGLRL